ncbi:MAG: hypothetical protein ACHQ4J_07030 [Candidatus Binatia bacterium]
MRRVMGLLLSDPAAIPIFVAIYVAAGVMFVLTDYTLNDEGLLTYYWGSWARQAFVPVFFFQRIRPVMAALYLPASAGGVHVTLIAHVVVAALSLPMLAAVARALGHRLPNLPALAVALSPLYFYGGPAGFSNTDGVVGICLALYLLCARRRPLLAGVVSGLLPWVRSELTIFSAAFALHGFLVRRDRSLLVGIGIFPLLYTIAGAFYHHDPIWILHFLPKTPADPLYTMWNGQLIGAQYFLEPLLAVSPIVPVIVALRLARLQPIERTLLLYSAVAAVALNVLPIFHIGNFGTSPRYSMALLPALAVLAGRAFEPWWSGERPTLVTLVAMALFAGWLATRQQDGTAVALLLIANLIFIAAVGLQLGTPTAALAVALMVAGPLLPIRLDVGRTITAQYLDPMVDWLRAHGDRISGPVLTNSQLLAPFVEGRLARVDVRFVVPIEMSREIALLTNPANGQRDRIRRLCETDLYGRTLFAPITPEDVPPNALLALRVEPRLSILLPEAVWGPRLQVLEETPQYRIARMRPAAAGALAR